MRLLHIASTILSLCAICLIQIAYCQASSLRHGLESGNTLYTEPMADSIAADSTTVRALTDSIASIPDTLVAPPMPTTASQQSQTKAKPIELVPWKPSSRRALIYSAILPGLGQAYNKQYWKVPIVWGALVGCTYAITWNHRTYIEYVTAYRDLANHDPEHQSWINFIPPGANPADYANSSDLLSRLQRGSATYRRYRDLSILVTAGVYLLNLLDAYVDAELFDFDISPDLSMHISPQLHRSDALQGYGLGLNCQLRF